MLNCELTNTDRVKVAFTQLPNFSDYLILYNMGLIWSNKSGRFIGSKRLDGYHQTTLYDDNGKVTTGLIHRFIYEAVYGPIPEGLDVNHINENKTDNRIENLNLMTRKENINFGTRTERASKAIAKALTNGVRSKPVGAFKDGKLVMRFPSTMEAGRNGFDQGNVASCCRGVKGYKTYKGYEWRYIN